MSRHGRTRGSHELLGSGMPETADWAYALLAGAHRGLSLVQGVQEVLGVRGLLQRHLLACDAQADGRQLLLRRPLHRAHTAQPVIKSGDGGVGKGTCRPAHMQP